PALGHSIQLLHPGRALGTDVRPRLSLLSLLGARLPESASLAGESHAGRGYQFSPMLECFLHVQRRQAPARTLRLPLCPRSTDLRTEVAGGLYTLLQRT